MLLPPSNALWWVSPELVIYCVKKPKNPDDKNAELEVAIGPLKGRLVKRESRPLFFSKPEAEVYVEMIKVKEFRRRDQEQRSKTMIAKHAKRKNTSGNNSS